MSCDTSALGKTVNALYTLSVAPTGIASDATSFYWTNENAGSVVHGPVAGGTPPTTLVAGLSNPVGIAAVTGATFAGTTPAFFYATGGDVDLYSSAASSVCISGIGFPYLLGTNFVGGARPSRPPGSRYPTYSATRSTSRRARTAARGRRPSQSRRGFPERTRRRRTGPTSSSARAGTRRRPRLSTPAQSRDAARSPIRRRTSPTRGASGASCSREQRHLDRRRHRGRSPRVREDGGVHDADRRGAERVHQRARGTERLHLLRERRHAVRGRGVAGTQGLGRRRHARESLVWATCAHGARRLEGVDAIVETSGGSRQSRFRVRARALRDGGGELPQLEFLGGSTEADAAPAADDSGVESFARA